MWDNGDPSERKIVHDCDNSGCCQGSKAQHLQALLHPVRMWVPGATPSQMEACAEGSAVLPGQRVFHASALVLSKPCSFPLGFRLRVTDPVELRDASATHPPQTLYTLSPKPPKP